MSCKSLTCLTVFCALVAGQALAVPTINVAGTASGGNVNWTVSFTPDATLLNAGLGTLATELSLESSTALVGGVTIDPNWMENINGTPIVNPGENPYTNAVTEGVTLHPNVASELGGGANVNAIFAALGSTKFTTTGSKLALSFTTMGSTGTLNWGGILAQDPNAAFVNVSGTLSVGGPNMKLFDANIDGTVNNADIDDMVLALGSNAAWEAAHPGFDILEYLDGNQDGSVNNADIDSYVVALGNPPFLVAPTSNVPEPSTVAVLFGAVLAVAGVRRKLAAA